MSIAVIVPTISERDATASVASIFNQKRKADSVHIISAGPEDNAAMTRNQALGILRIATNVEWVAVLDDDDTWLPNHLATLGSIADQTSPSVAVVHGWYENANEAGFYDDALDPAQLADGRHPTQALKGHYNRDLKDDLMAKPWLPVTSLYRASALLRIGGWPVGDALEDWGLYKKLIGYGYGFYGVTERTWVWHHHDLHTSGKPENRNQIYHGGGANV